REWCWRMSVCGERSYRLCVVRRSGEPVRYVAVRRMQPGRPARWGRDKTALVTDLVAIGDDPDVLLALARRALAIAGEMRAVALLTVTTMRSHCRALAASGFLSPDFPLLGRVLRGRAPVFMWLPK